MSFTNISLKAILFPQKNITEMHRSVQVSSSQFLSAYCKPLRPTVDKPPIHQATPHVSLLQKIYASGFLTTSNFRGWIWQYLYSRSLANIQQPIASFAVYTTDALTVIHRSEVFLKWNYSLHIHKNVERLSFEKSKCTLYICKT